MKYHKQKVILYYIALVAPDGERYYTGRGGGRYDLENLFHCTYGVGYHVSARTYTEYTTEPDSSDYHYDCVSSEDNLPCALWGEWGDSSTDFDWPQKVTWTQKRHDYFCEIHNKSMEITTKLKSLIDENYKTRKKSAPFLGFTRYAVEESGI